MSCEFKVLECKRWQSLVLIICQWIDIYWLPLFHFQIAKFIGVKGQPYVSSVLKEFIGFLLYFPVQEMGERGWFINKKKIP
jgi:hypothetical protein